MNKLKTINLKGKDYIQVNTRVTHFNETYPNGKIETKPSMADNGVYFKATVTPDVKNLERFFTGHSFGKLGAEKALEKLETVAVGRALAFMGIGIVEGIASADEVNNFQNNQNTISNKLGSKLPYEQQLKEAEAGNMKCLDCGSVAVTKFSQKHNKTFINCPNDWQHKNFISNKEIQEIKVEQPAEVSPF